LQDQGAVADADRQRTAGAAFADDAADDRRPQFGHHVQVTRDGFGLAALLGANARVCAGRVNEGEDRQAELFRQTHQAQGLAIPSGRGMPKLRTIFSLVSRPFWWPITITGSPLKRAMPPTIAASSA